MPYVIAGGLLGGLEGCLLGDIADEFLDLEDRLLEELADIADRLKDETPPSLILPLVPHSV